MSTSTDTAAGIDTTTGLETSPTYSRPISAADLVRRGLTTAAVVLLSLAAVRVVAGLFVPLEGVEPTSWGPVLGTGVVVTVGATAVYAVLTRLLDRSDRVFVGLAAVVLAVMHVVAAVGSVVVLTGRWP